MFQERDTDRQVQPGTQEQIPDTFLGSADQTENDSFRIEPLSWFGMDRNVS